MIAGAMKAFGHDTQLRGGLCMAGDGTIGVQASKTTGGVGRDMSHAEGHPGNFFSE